ncbi:branched-chain amino acid ABC transporter substrate-binding protein [Chelativorans alearense]|uniref:branched-chain amino acid ABC transporter substrate-binding protein n=1 Tax=Chelativorans alearense TaxID=2681495 RepID=UPI001FEC2C4A|nr:branched-chain amino acid ABC transporter substrate-binding protein [Chelativorans alearense]
MLALQLSALAAVGPAHAQEVIVGLAAPLSGNFATLGTQWAEGARTAAGRDAGARLVEADDACTKEGGAAAARALVEAGAAIVIGFLCTPAVEAAMPILKEAGVPVVTPVRTGGLTDQKARTGWPVYRLGPRSDDEREAVADILTRRWRNEFFAIVDDGTIYGRELAENLRAAAGLAELEPVFTDTFRPQLDNQIGLVGRLRRAGATHVFVGGDRSDIAIMARDAGELGYQVTLAGGEALKAEDGLVPLAAGVLMVGLPEWHDLASPQILQALREAGVEPEGYVLPGYAAVQLATGAVRVAAEDDRPVGEILNDFAFDTAIGIVRFDEKGDLARNIYRLFRYDGEEFVEVE